MNARERFNAVMNFEPVDRGLFTPFFWPWEATVERWRGEGLGDMHWAEPFGFDVSNDHAAEFTIVPAKSYVFPFYEREVLEEEPGRALIRDKSGVTKYIRTDGQTMVQIQSWPVTDQASWEEFKQRLDPDTPGIYVNTLEHTPDDPGAKWTTASYRVLYGYNVTLYMPIIHRH